MSILCVRSGACDWHLSWCVRFCHRALSWCWALWSSFYLFRSWTTFLLHILCRHLAPRQQYFSNSGEPLQRNNRFPFAHNLFRWKPDAESGEYSVASSFSSLWSSRWMIYPCMLCTSFTSFKCEYSIHVQLHQSVLEWVLLWRRLVL